MPDQETYLIDDFGPIPVVQPQSVAQVCDHVRRAAADGLAIYPVGGGTMLNLGMPPTRRGIAVDLRRLNQVIDYPARDMTITVQAGITIGTLQALLATENQQLPIDVPYADRATLGGVIATNTSGPRRYGYGTLRDYVIGISVINDEGQETKAGGRVVKNVAGYDLCKLHIGALGTLGIISQVTLKLKPLAQRGTLVAIHCRKDLEGVLECLHATRTRPLAITVLTPQAAAGIFPNCNEPESVAVDGWLVVVGLEGNEEAIHWQVNQLQREVSNLGIPLRRQWPNETNRQIWEGLSDFPLSVPASVTFRADILPSATASFCERLTQWQDRLVFHTHAGNGIVIGHLDTKMSLEEAAPLTHRLLDLANEHEGNLVLLRCPPAWKNHLPVWGKPRADNWLMRAVKDKLDPKGLFNPGRFVAGI